jgi:hypothetical protein
MLQSIDNESAGISHMHTLWSAVQRIAHVSDLDRAARLYKGARRKLCRPRLAAAKHMTDRRQRQGKMDCARPWATDSQGLGRVNRSKHIEQRRIRLACNRIDTTANATQPPCNHKLLNSAMDRPSGRNDTIKSRYSNNRLACITQDRPQENSISRKTRNR